MNPGSFKDFAQYRPHTSRKREEKQNHILTILQQVPVLDEVGPAEHDDGVGEHDEVADEDAERVRLERLDGGVAVAANEKRRSNYSHTLF